MGQILAINTVAESAEGAEAASQEVVFGVVALSAGKEGTIVCQKPISSIIVVAIDATRAAMRTVFAGVFGVKVARHADAGVGGQLVVEVAGAVGALVDVALALVAVGIDAFIAG